MATFYPTTISLISFLLAHCITLFVPLPVSAEVVTARIYQEDNRTTYINIDLLEPAPSTIIVEMQLPQGTRIIETSPRFSKQNKKTHTLKWLMKNTKTGSSTIKIRTEADLDLSSSQVFIRYRINRNGTLREVQAKQQ